MGSNKVLVLVGFLLALVLLITSEVAARDLAETSTQKENTEVNDAKYPGNGNGGYPGNGYGGYPGGGGGGNYNGGGGNYGGGGGNRGGNYGGGRNRRGYCRYDCCYRGGGGGYYNGQRGCRRCCSYAGEATDIANKN